MTRLTKRIVDGLMCAPSGSPQFAWDSLVSGFGVRVFESGKKVFLVRYRLGSKQRFLSLGPVGSPYTVETARDRAREVLRDVAEGRDPQAAKVARRHAMTVGELIERYLSEGPLDKPNKRPSSWQTDASNLNRHVRPILGKKVAVDVTPTDVNRLRRDIETGKTAVDVKTGPRGRAIVEGGKGIASRTLSVTQAMFAWALKSGELRGENPVRGVARAQPTKKERFLTAKEIAALFKSMTKLESDGRVHPRHADMIRLLLLTGARRSEVVYLRWSEVDLQRRVIALPPDRHKTGSKTGEKRIPIAEVATQLIDRQSRANEFVFASLRESEPKPTLGVDRAWRLIRGDAGLADVRLHDLRHSFVSFGMAEGESLFLVGKVLGHTAMAMTEKYAHLGDDPVRRVADRTAEAIVRAAAVSST
ncbi:MAG: tyrosine-type recombinase/integrase [Bauldia sp.]